MSEPGNSEPNSAADGQREPKIVVRDRRRVDPATGSARADPASGSGEGRSETARPAASAADASSSVSNPELTALRTQLAERTNDLQRITAEYANYRKRMERDRVAVVEHGTAGLLTTLLPVLNDIERARSHGDLEGAFASVAEQLLGLLAKSGLRALGEVGEKFDPLQHEAVTHSVSPDVTEAKCTQVLRQGYWLGERLLRTALVGVTEPAGGPTSGSQPIAAETSDADSAAGDSAAHIDSSDSAHQDDSTKWE